MRQASIYDRLGETLPLLAVKVTESTWERVRPWSGLTEPAAGHGLIIEPGSLIHTFGRRGSVDVVFLGADWTVLRIVARLAPRRIAMHSPAARVVALVADGAERLHLRIGMKLYCLEESPQAGPFEPSVSVPHSSSRHQGTSRPGASC